MNVPEKKVVPEYDIEHGSWGNYDDSYSHGYDIGYAQGFNAAIDVMTVSQKITEVMEKIKP